MKTFEEDDQLCLFDPATYDDSIVSQMVECIKVFRDGKLIIIFGGGYEVEEHI